MRKLIPCLIIVILFAFPSVIAEELVESFIVAKDVNKAREAIENEGSLIKHVFLEDKVLIAGVPNDLKSNKIYTVYNENSKGPKGFNRLFEIWQLSLNKDKEELPKNLDYLNNDTLLIEKSIKKELSTISFDYSPGYTDTSSYMIGDVSVSVITPESLSGSEDWTDEELNQVYSEILNGLDWWANLNPGAHLTFIYNFGERVSIPYEPIELPIVEGQSWIHSIYNELGYSGDDHVELSYDYVNYQRDLKKTDWAFVIFVVDSSNDVDGRFADGNNAFAVIGGPYMVMPYDNGGYTINNMEVVTAHETGHIFGALDQYPGSCLPEHRAGYLYYENQNCADGGSSDEYSIMRTALYPYANGLVDYYARGQIGWADSDEDGVLDIIDIEPEVSVNSEVPDEPDIYHPDKKVLSNLSKGRNVLNNYFSYDGEASLGVFEAINPNYNTVSINKVASVQYRTSKTGPWAKVNKIKEISPMLWKYKFNFQLFYPAKYVVEIKAIDRFGLETSEENYARIKIFV